VPKLAEQHSAPLQAGDPGLVLSKKAKKGISLIALFNPYFKICRAVPWLFASDFPYF